jgi:hypothetical protein
MNPINIIFQKFILVFAVSCLLFSCSQEIYDTPAEVTSDMLDASFSVEGISDHTFTLTANSNEYVINHQWDLGDGDGFVTGENTVTLTSFFAGVYEVKHLVSGAGGVCSDTVTYSITIEEDAPLGDNLIVGGTFDTDAAIAQWSIGGCGGGGTWTFADSKATLTATGWVGEGIYQAIDVEEGSYYKVDMTASSTSGCIDTWFEVYCGYTVPGSTDYDEGQLYAISTWDGEATSAFSGKIGEIGTATDDGVFYATATGTVYLVIRGGGNDMQDGISITDVEFSEYQDN